MRYFFPLAGSFHIGSVPPGSVAITDVQFEEYSDKLKAGYAATWTGTGWTYTPPIGGGEPSIHYTYGIRFVRRAAALTSILAYIQADIDIRRLNGEFGRSGRPEIMAIPEVMLMFAHLHNLSFGLAISTLMGASHALLGAGLKGDWIGQINANLYNTGTPYTD